MPAPGITVLKHNAPWGPFTREQIEAGLARGDFTLKYLAHTPGLKEWLPLGEVLDHVERSEGPRLSALPPVPESSQLPPVPSQAEQTTAKPPPPAPLTVSALPLAQPPILPTGLSGSGGAPALPMSPALEKPEIKPDPKPEVKLTPASFFPRTLAFLIDAAILFVPVGILYILGALAIEIPAAWRHIPHQSRMEEWALLDQNMHRLAWLVAVGFGWLYGAGLECSPSQATVGKRWMGIKVTDAQGERISFLRATGRYAAKYLSALPCFLGFIMALFSSRNLTLHDRLSETRVVRR
jgi:uncharacterized RDD family membrane protein YckC